MTVGAAPTVMQMVDIAPSEDDAWMAVGMLMAYCDIGATQARQLLVDDAEAEGRAVDEMALETIANHHARLKI